MSAETEAPAIPSNGGASKSKAKERTPSELLCAVAVAGIAFWAPADDTGFVLRLIYSALALGALLMAVVALEILMDSTAKPADASKPANPFEVAKTKRVELPTAPPGGVFAAASKMDELLQGFPVDIKSRVTPTENGFQIMSGAERLRVKVLAGSAIGWEHGSPQWVAKRDEWIAAVQAAPRCKEVMQVEWMGIGELMPEEKPAAAAAGEGGGGGGGGGGGDGEAEGGSGGAFEAGFTVVKIDGLAAKPQLNGKLGVVTKGVNEAGRVGVRPEGQKDSLLLSQGKLEPLPDFSRLGVSIPCMRAFLSAVGPMLTGLTVEKAIDSVIRPLTNRCQCSVADALRRKKAADEAGHLYVGPATVFLCYTDSVTVTELLDVMERYAKAQAKGKDGKDGKETTKVEEIYVSIDLMCTNHHLPTPSHDLPMLWWQTSFKQSLKQMKHGVCLALLPWDEPYVLKRSWCHWALHCALSLKLPVSIETTSSEAEKLSATLVEDMDAPMRKLDTRLDGFKRNAEAPTEAQRAAVEKAIDRAYEKDSRDKGGPPTTGHEEFGRQLADILHKWLLDRAKKVLDDQPKEGRGTSILLDRVAKLLQDFGDLPAAEPLCREQVEGRAKKLGETHRDTLDACHNLAMLLHQLGKLEEAEPYSRRKLAGARATLGDRHPDTITAIDTTSQLLSDLGKLDQALPLKRESLAEKRRTIGDRHPDTLLSVNNLAVLLNDLGRQTGDMKLLREAEPLKREALAGCREVLGNRHPHTLASVSNLADMLMQLAPADPRALAEAEVLAREAMAGTREVLGMGHPETLKAIGMMATLLVEMGHHFPPEAPQRLKIFKEAEPLYKEAVEGFTKGLGQYHPTPLSYQHEHTRLLLEMDRAKKAEEKARETVKGCRATLGDSHPETLISITHLGSVLRHQKRYDEAVVMAREVRLGWMNYEREAKVPPRNTLTATNILAEMLHSMGNNAEAEPLCREVLNGFLKAVGPKHPFTISGAENLSNVLRALKKDSEADKVLQQFGMKTPVGGTIAEEAEGMEEEDEEEVLEGIGTPAKANGNGGGSPSKNGNGKAKALLAQDLARN